MVIMENRQFKNLPYFPVKSADSTGRVRKGIAAVFGNIDSWGDRILPGAFAKTLTEGRQRAKHLWNHSFSQPPIAKIVEIKEIGRADLPDEVLQYAPDATGGLMVARDYYKNEFSNWILEAIDAGDINEMSFGYDVISSNETTEGEVKVRNLTELKLYDTSDVLWGMNPATVGVGAKGFDSIPLGTVVQQLTGIAEAVKSGRRNAISDESLINAIHQASVDLGSTKCLGIKEAEESESEEKAEAVNPDTSLFAQRLELQKLQLELVRSL